MVTISASKRAFKFLREGRGKGFTVWFRLSLLNDGAGEVNLPRQYRTYPGLSPCACLPVFGTGFGCAVLEKHNEVILNSAFLQRDIAN